MTELTNILREDLEAREALRVLDQLPDNVSRTLFIVDKDDVMVGSLTDGDIRRGLLNGMEISQPVNAFMYKSFKFIKEGNDNVEVIKKYREADIHLVPSLDDNGRICQILDLKKARTILPISVLIMAGGRGERLRPFTDNVPKPMLMVGDKPLIEHNIDRLIAFGAREIFISVKYLKHQIMDHFGDGSSKGVSIHYIEETEPLGTLGALSLVDKVAHEDLLVMNSDILTNIDFEDFYNFYRTTGASMALASIPFNINVPYAVLETSDHMVNSFTEKPTYTYYSNGGIYLMKSALKLFLKEHSFFNATDMMDLIIKHEEHKLVHYPLLGYWLDIGRQQDYLKAQEDIKHISLH